jgi:hypothetical protein
MPYSLSLFSFGAGAGNVLVILHLPLTSRGHASQYQKNRRSFVTQVTKKERFCEEGPGCNVDFFAARDCLSLIFFLSP